MDSTQVFDEVTLGLCLDATEFEDKVDEVMIHAGGWVALEQSLRAAYLSGERRVLQGAHRALNRIYALLTSVHDPDSASPEVSPVLARLRFTL